MKFTWFTGVDVSKATLDVAFCHQNSPDQLTHQQFTNTTAGFKQLLTWLKKQKVDLTQSFFCMEHTGHYTLALCCRFGGPIFARSRPILYASESSALETVYGYYPRQERSSERRAVDAKRIAQFACLHQRKLQPMQLPSACLLKLKNLMAFRDRLTKTKRGRPAVSLKQTIADLKDTGKLVDNSFIIKQSEKQLKLVEEQIKHTARRPLTSRWKLPYRKMNRYKTTSD